MRIEIAQRYKPFSHIPGVFCMLPGTTWRMQVFPALLKIDDLSGSFPKPCGEVFLDLKGPVKDFTVLLDLEKGRVHVFGAAANGYFRYHLKAINQEEMELIADKGPLESRTFHFPASTIQSMLLAERLSLGNHKAQDWTLIWRRQDLAEIMPLWLRLGQWTPEQGAIPPKPSLLALCEQSKNPYQAFLDLLNAGFDEILAPRVYDEQFQGYPLAPLADGVSPLLLLTEGARLIRRLFVHQEGRRIALLPNLPEQFHCGRFTSVQFPEVGTSDFEWSKKRMRRMIFAASHSGQVQFIFPKELQSMRLTVLGTSKRVATSSAIDILPGERYLLDRFEH